MGALRTTLRMRAADFDRARSLRVDGADLRVPPRVGLEPGAPLRIEVSFGPLADEVDLLAEIVGETEDGGYLARVDARCEAQLSYIREVLGGAREAAARRFRRVPSSLRVQWRDAAGSVVSRLLDISLGGAFILAEEAPPVGSRITVEVGVGAGAEGAKAPITLESIVSWVRAADADAPRAYTRPANSDSGRHPIGGVAETKLPRRRPGSSRSGAPPESARAGFGVRFRPAGPEMASRLGALVREHEHSFDGAIAGP